MEFHFGVDELTPKIIEQIISGECWAVLTENATKKVHQSRKSLETIANSGKKVYGINTGFGVLCDTLIDPTSTDKLQENLLLSHAVGLGKPVEKRLSKIMLIAKIHALCQGYSGVRMDLIERLILHFQKDLIPVVPEKGSLGASGDLAPLSHLFLPLIGYGQIWKNGEPVEASEVLAEHQIEPLQLGAKEGLALINGTQFIVAQSVAALLSMDYLFQLADLSGAMSLEGFQGSSAPFKKELHELRPHKGCIKVAEHMQALLKNSHNVQSHEGCNRVQDPYSFRCIPQVHGASWAAYDHLFELTLIELNSITDNPLIIDETLSVSGGNFHGQPLAMVLDYACIAAAEIGNISDRRAYALLEGKFGLPRLLTPESGLNSGLMIAQYTGAALVSENKVLCHPASADSIPTSVGQEDHVSMGSIAGRKLNQILENLKSILAIELLIGAQAMDFRRPNTFSEILEYNHQKIRERVSFMKHDRLLKSDIDAIVHMIDDKVFTP